MKKNSSNNFLVFITIIFISYPTFGGNNIHYQNSILSTKDSLVEGVNEISFQLLKDLGHSKKNLFFSPLSVASTFAMLYPGTMGETKNEIQRFFHLSQSTDENSKQFNKLNNILLDKQNSSSEVNIANALWIQKDYKIKQPFIEQTKTYFNSELYLQDFVNSPEKSCDAMNKWISAKTNNKINDIINAGELNSSTKLILTNAIYFDGKWRNEFDKNHTKDTIFYNSDNTQSTIEMMHKTDDFNYFEDSLFQALELPYEDDYSMVVFLPKSDSTNPVGFAFNYPNYQKALSSMYHTEVILSIPKFSLKNEIQLSDVLKANGIKSAFSTEANLSGIADNLSIGNCYQSSFITVNEEKTEATAVGVVSIEVMAALIENPDPPKIFNANHSFVFAIVSKITNAILFLGKIDVMQDRQSH